MNAAVIKSAYKISQMKRLFHDATKATRGAMSIVTRQNELLDVTTEMCKVTMAENDVLKEQLSASKATVTSLRQINETLTAQLQIHKNAPADRIDTLVNEAIEGTLELPKEEGSMSPQDFGMSADEDELDRTVQEIIEDKEVSWLHTGGN